MSVINIVISVPELSNALEKLAEALSTSMATPLATQPVQAEPVPASPVNPVPIAPAPTYSIEDLAHAGAFLAQTGKIAEAKNLLNQYGIMSISELKPEQSGSFATALRALGAPI